MDHATRRFQEARLADVMARLLGLDGLLNKSGEILIRPTPRQHAIKVVIEVGEKAGPDFAIGSKAYAAAGTAKGLRYGRDDADFPYPVVESITARGLTRTVGGKSHERAEAVQFFDHLRQRHNHFRRPQAIFFQGHELYKTNDHAFVSGEAGEGDHLVVV